MFFLQKYFRDLHLEDVDDVNKITTSFLIKRATDAITFRDDGDDVRDGPLYDFKYASFIIINLVLNKKNG